MREQGKIGVPHNSEYRYNGLTLVEAMAMLLAIAEMRESWRKKQTKLNESAMIALMQRNSPEVLAKAYIDIYHHCLSKLSID